EEVGFFNPCQEPNELSVNKEAVEKWLANGAQPTDTVKTLLKKSGVEM
ncbi:MAG: 30S ribosomal protein S16, partial [Niameybacter sp.]